MAEKVLFIINKYSGKGFESAVEGQVIAGCARHDVEGTIKYTTHKGHAAELAHQAVQDGFSRVFAMGGDGTVNEVARGLAHTPAALGILPTGSGNGLARHLNIPLAIHRALDLLHQYQTIFMDTLLVNGHLSVNVAGIGFDAHVASLFGENGKRGLAGYAKLTLREFNRFKEFEVHAELDGKSHTGQSFIVALANSSQFGNNARVAPHASVCDGMIDVCFIRKVPFVEVVPFAARIFFGKFDQSRFVEIIQAKNLRAELSREIPYHLDGEACAPSRTFDVSIQPRSLKVMVPKSVAEV